MFRTPRLGRRQLIATAAGVAAWSAIPRARAADMADMAKAKAEGKVVWYTSTPIATAQTIAQMFEAESGVHVELFRSGGSAILRRFMQESQAQMVAADVLTTSDPAAAAALAARGIFVPFKPPGFEMIPAAAKDPAGNYIAQRLNMITIYLRGDKIAPADRPKGWADLTDPRYKGELVMTDPSFTSLQLAVVGTLSQKFGWSYYEKLRQGGIMIVPGNQQVSDSLKQGERLIAAGALDSYAADDRRKGADIVSIYPADGTFIIPSPTAVVKGAPHPNAAKALAAFMITPAVQALFPQGGGYAARTDMPPPKGAPAVKDLMLLSVDYPAIEKNATAIKNRFDEIFQ
jgi:iron(III) transport system substrate-binding protein